MTFYGITCDCGMPRIRQAPDTDGKYLACQCGARLVPMDPPGTSAGDVDAIRVRIIQVMKGFVLTGRLPFVQEREVQPHAGDADALRREVAGLNDEIARLRAENVRLKSELSDANGTCAHLRNEVRRAGAVDVRGAMEEISDYMCDICNAPDRKDSLEKLGSFVRNRTEMAIMNLEGRGVTVEREVPGERLAGNAEVCARVRTSDEGLNGRVASADRFGCSFRDDAFPRIPGSVSLYSYVPKEERLRSGE